MNEWEERVFTTADEIKFLDEQIKKHPDSKSEIIKNARTRRYDSVIDRNKILDFLKLKEEGK